MIEVRNLTKSFGPVRAVKDISFDVAEGQIVGFLGPNGAGKSTTLRILTGYHPAGSGSARVAGFDVFTESMKVRQHIGYLPESTPLYPEMRVREFLKFRAKLKGVPGSQIAARIGFVAGECWLEEFVDRPIGQLSKGMKQRVGLADALINDPKVLFLDEPTIGLDPTQVRQTRSLIAKLGERHTVMLSSHILSEVEAICSDVIIIARGEVVAQGAPSELSAKISKSSRLISEIKGQDGEVVSAVKGMAGVRKVESEKVDGWCRLRIDVDAGSDIRPQVAKLAADKSWELREIRHEVASLEDFFVKIVAEQGTKGIR
jgi:ABC-2 type transport system ATP-binding protein